MLEKEELIRELQKLKVPYDSSWSRLRLHELHKSLTITVESSPTERLIDRPPDLENMPESRVIEVTGTRNRRDSQYQRKWNSIPYEIEEAILESFGVEEEICFGRLYYEADDVCPQAKMSMCDVAQYCQQVQEEAMNKESEESVLDIPEEIADEVQSTVKNLTLTTCKLLARALRQEFLKTKVKGAWVKKQETYDTYYLGRESNKAFQVRKDRGILNLLVREEVTEKVEELGVYGSEESIFIDFFLMTAHDAKQHKPMTHKLRVRPRGIPAVQAADVMSVLREVYGF